MQESISGLLRHSSSRVLTIQDRQRTGTAHPTHSVHIRPGGNLSSKPWGQQNHQRLQLLPHHAAQRHFRMSKLSQCHPVRLLWFYANRNGNHIFAARTWTKLGNDHASCSGTSAIFCNFDGGNMLEHIGESLAWKIIGVNCGVSTLVVPTCVTCVSSSLI